MLTDFHLPPASGAAPERAVIFLHGLGDSGSGGLLSIGRIWQRELPDCAFLCPDAPFAYDMVPGDTGGRQWFSLQSFAYADMLAGAKTAAPILNEYIDHVLASRSLTPDRLALAGFSQGAMMALYAAPRRSHPVAGIIGYSGILLGAETLAAEKKSAPPALLIHGMRDDVVPYAALADAERGLTAAGIKTMALSRPDLGHGIDDEGLAAGLRFLGSLWP